MGYPKFLKKSPIFNEAALRMNVPENILNPAVASSDMTELVDAAARLVATAPVLRGDRLVAPCSQGQGHSTAC